MARLPYITGKEQLAHQDHAAFDSIVASRGAVQGPFTMFLNSPDLAQRVAHVGALRAVRGSLDTRVRVLAAMTVAREFDALYVWARRPAAPAGSACRIRPIAAIRENHSRGIPPEDAQIVDFTRQLLRQHRIDNATAQAMLARFGNDEYDPAHRGHRLPQPPCMTVNACELEAAQGAEVLQS